MIVFQIRDITFNEKKSNYKKEIYSVIYYYDYSYYYHHYYSYYSHHYSIKATLFLSSQLLCVFNARPYL